MAHHEDSERRELARGAPAGMPVQYYRDDEISLFDLWDVLVRRRWIIIIVAAVVTGLALLHALTQPELYAFRSAIQIGSYVSNDEEQDRRYIEPLPAVGHRLEKSAVPAAREEISQPEEPAPQVEVRTRTNTDDDDGTGLFILYTEGQPEDKERIETLHRTVITNVRNLHQQLLDPVQSRSQNRLEDARERLAFLQRPEIERSRFEPLEQAVQEAERTLSALEAQYRSERLELENQLADKRRQILELKDSHALIEARLARMDERESLTEEQLQSLQERIAQLEKASARTTAETQTSGDAMALLVVAAELNRAQTRADQLEERLRVGIPEQRDELRDSLRDNQRAQEKVLDDIESLENQLQKLKEDYERRRANAQDALDTAKTRLARERADYENEILVQKRGVRNAMIALQEIRPTEALFVGDRGLQPVGTSGKVIVALGIVLGGMLGVFAAFFVEFVHAANKRRREGGAAEMESGS